MQTFKLKFLGVILRGRSPIFVLILACACENNLRFSEVNAVDKYSKKLNKNVLTYLPIILIYQYLIIVFTNICTASYDNCNGCNVRN